jgi:hypothetical protein
VLVLLLASASLARLEVQIEGETGWASGLPTWRIDNRWTRAVLGRALTGYHVWFHALLLLLVHLVWALGAVPFSWRVEARIIAFLVLLWVLEDFLWFLFNPAYGVRAFTAERAWWHARRWWWIAPREYWWFIPLGVALYILSWR